ncbi:hypothetical protein ACFX11_033371 [Malus domestica]
MDGVYKLLKGKSTKSLEFLLWKISGGLDRNERLVVAEALGGGAPDLLHTRFPLLPLFPSDLSDFPVLGCFEL